MRHHCVTKATIQSRQPLCNAAWADSPDVIFYKLFLVDVSMLHRVIDNNLLNHQRCFKTSGKKHPLNSFAHCLLLHRVSKYYSICFKKTDVLASRTQTKEEAKRPAYPYVLSLLLFFPVPHYQAHQAPLCQDPRPLRRHRRSLTVPHACLAETHTRPR